MYVFNISSRQQKIAINLLTLFCHRGNSVKPQSLTVYREKSSSWYKHPSCCPASRHRISYLFGRRVTANLITCSHYSRRQSSTFSPSSSSSSCSFAHRHTCTSCSRAFWIGIRTGKLQLPSTLQPWPPNSPFGAADTSLAYLVHFLNPRHSVMGIFWKCARIGERLSPYISIFCVVMAVRFSLSPPAPRPFGTPASLLLLPLRNHTTNTSRSAQY
jgi:hypothetical protein